MPQKKLAMMLSAANVTACAAPPSKPAEIGLGEEAAVDHHFQDEQDGQHADLQDHLAEARQPRRPLDAVTLAKPLALDLVFVQASPQHEQLIAADGGLGAEIADRLGRRLLDGGKALLEAKAR